jgi:predicted metal-dependent phosphoesterase TrpH
MKADLHIHSTVSDGSAAISEIVEMAKGKGLDAIAVTDHDTLSHASRMPEGSGVRVLAGVEISAVHRESGMKAHVLGYRVGKPDIIAALTRPLLEARNANSERQADLLRRMGYRIDMDKLARADGKYLYKQHIMDQLVSTGQVPDMFGAFYQKTFKQGGVCAFDIEYIDVYEAVRAIKEAGGLAVLAHPGQQQNFRLVPELAGLGLDGLEMNHHAHSPADKAAIRDYAGRYGLFLTGGSDYHGRYGAEPLSVGDLLAEESGAEAIC